MVYYHIEIVIFFSVEASKETFTHVFKVIYLISMLKYVHKQDPKGTEGIRFSTCTTFRKDDHFGEKYANYKFT